MNADYEISPEAVDDLNSIWSFIAEDSVDAANRVEAEFFELFDRIARAPGIGHRRSDLTPREVFFFPIYRYVIVYDRSSSPLRIVRILSGYLDVARILG